MTEDCVAGFLGNAAMVRFVAAVECFDGLERGLSSHFELMIDDGEIFCLERMQFRHIGGNGGR